jgi:hypothetical protein
MEVRNDAPLTHEGNTRQRYQHHDPFLAGIFLARSTDGALEGSTPIPLR